MSYRGFYHSRQIGFTAKSGLFHKNPFPPEQLIYLSYLTVKRIYVHVSDPED